jgi:hypothetical protein
MDKRTDYELGERAKLVICFDYEPPQAGCHTQPNGDPGWPDEPESIEVTDVQVWTRLSPSQPWVNSGVSLPEEVTDNDWLVERCSDAIVLECEAAEAVEMDLWAQDMEATQ